MDKNPLINIRPKIKDKIIKDENFSNSDNHPLQLPLKSVKETIYDLIKKNFKKENNLSLKDKELVSIVLRSYHKSFKKIKLEDSEFILAKHEISEF